MNPALDWGLFLLLCGASLGFRRPILLVFAVLGFTLATGVPLSLLPLAAVGRQALRDERYLLGACVLAGVLGAILHGREGGLFLAVLPSVLGLGVLQSNRGPYWLGFVWAAYWGGVLYHQPWLAAVLACLLAPVFSDSRGTESPGRLSLEEKVQRKKLVKSELELRGSHRRLQLTRRLATTLLSSSSPQGAQSRIEQDSELSRVIREPKHEKYEEEVFRQTLCHLAELGIRGLQHREQERIQLEGATQKRQSSEATLRSWDHLFRGFLTLSELENLKDLEAFSERFDSSSFGEAEKQLWVEALALCHQRAALRSEVSELQATLAQREKELLETRKVQVVGFLAASLSQQFLLPLKTVRKVLSGVHSARESLEKRRLVALAELERAENLLLELSGQSALSDQGDARVVEVLEAVSNAFQVSGGEVDFQWDRSALAELKVRLASGRLQQILTNLIRNALDASSDSPETVSLKVTTQDGSVIFEVMDRGPGVPVEILDRIFDPFFTTKEVGRGTGLGLSIAKSLALQGGGSLEFHPREGGGAIFVLSLPAL